MDCPKCGIEMRVDSEETEAGIRQSFSCRNPQCSGFKAVQATVTLKGAEISAE